LGVAPDSMARLSCVAELLHLKTGGEIMTERRFKICTLTLCFLLTAMGVAANAQDSNNINQWQTKGKFEYHVYKLRPTDWPQGQATSPEACGMTPAQGAKYQCKTITYEGRPYYYYEGEQGRIYARRPVVQLYETPGAPVSK
jgi:hypothetical protein